MTRYRSLGLTLALLAIPVVAAPQTVIEMPNTSRMFPTPRVGRRP